MSKHKQFIMGLPGAGKTTFLAALWHVLESNDVDAKLKLHKVHTDHAYLESIRNLWLDAKEIDRTAISDEKYVSMLLKNGDDIAEIIFPDLSGESFRQQWAEREIANIHAEMLEDADGCLLFIHPDKVVNETLISEVNEIVLGEAAAGQEPEDPWDPIKSPTQVQLVELLQFSAYINKRRPIKLSIIVSAWDLLISKYQTPSQWTKKQLSLFWQYLTANPEIYETKYFGISAQGGALDNADDLRKMTPSEKIIVIDDNKKQSHDITLPISWIMEQ